MEEEERETANEIESRLSHFKNNDSIEFRLALSVFFFFSHFVFVCSFSLRLNSKFEFFFIRLFNFFSSFAPFTFKTYENPLQIYTL